MSNQRHILVLTADAGFGHRSAAQAIASALQDSHGGDAVVEVVNLLDDKNTPALLRDSQSEYDKTVRGIPDLYRFGYEVSDKSLPTTVIESTVTLMLLEAVQHLL
ncbi:MAG TPA: hypothetical protein VMT24_12740, partial [Aggregatilineaceae bacterium]|nr:hypothetical protein [Aggregatilineaceae bacterium]